MKAPLRSLEEVLQDYLSKPDGGEVTVDELQRQVSNQSRWDIINQLRRRPEGMFVLGRKGNPSRFVFGKPAEKRKLMHSIESIGENNTAEIPLRIMIEDKLLILPIKIKLVPLEVQAPILQQGVIPHTSSAGA